MSRRLRAARLVEVGYVVTVAGLTGYAFRSPEAGFGVAEALAGILTLPMILPALPVIYLLGALAWNLSDADGGGPMLPVTITFTAMLALVATANVGLVHLVWSGRWIR